MEDPAICLPKHNSPILIIGSSVRQIMRLELLSTSNTQM